MKNNFFQKSFHLWDNVEKYGTAREAIGMNIAQRMRIAGCITQATDTHLEHVRTNIYCFSTIRMDTRKCHSVPFISTLVVTFPLPYA
jgi:hypothetical protein